MADFGSEWTSRIVFSASFHFKTSFGEKNAEGRFENGLGSVTEMGVKGYPFIISRRLSARFD